MHNESHRCYSSNPMSFVKYTHITRNGTDTMLQHSQSICPFSFHLLFIAVDFNCFSGKFRCSFPSCTINIFGHFTAACVHIRQTTKDFRRAGVKIFVLLCRLIAFLNLMFIIKNILTNILPRIILGSGKT